MFGHSLHWLPVCIQKVFKRIYVIAKSLSVMEIQMIGVTYKGTKYFTQQMDIVAVSLNFKSSFRMSKGGNMSRVTE